MQRPVILLSGLPPDLPDGFIRQPYRPSDRPALPTALPEALAAGSHGSSLPPTLPAGFVSQTFRPPDRQTCRMVSYVGLTDRQTGLPYRQPYLKLSPAGSHGSSLPDGFIRQTYRQVSFQRPDRPASPVARPAASPASLTSQPYRQPHRQPHRPATPASPTSQPNRPTRPAINTSHQHQPSRPVIHPGKGPAGLPYR